MRKIFSLHKVMYRNLSEYIKEAMMALNPQDIKPLTAQVISVKGECSAGHQVGDTLELSSLDNGGFAASFTTTSLPT